MLKNSLQHKTVNVSQSPNLTGFQLFFHQFVLGCLGYFFAHFERRFEYSREIRQTLRYFWQSNG